MAAKSTTEERYANPVTQMAQIVPTGMEACGSARSPDLFEPAMIPGDTTAIVYSSNNDFCDLNIL